LTSRGRAAEGGIGGVVCLGGLEGAGWGREGLRMLIKGSGWRESAVGDGLREFEEGVQLGVVFLVVETLISSS
jgi:hypothetical protein